MVDLLFFFLIVEFFFGCFLCVFGQNSEGKIGIFWWCIKKYFVSLMFICDDQVLVVKIVDLDVFVMFEINVIIVLNELCVFNDSNNVV